jgi:hypothetical protein
MSFRDGGRPPSPALAAQLPTLRIPEAEAAVAGGGSGGAPENSGNATPVTPTALSLLQGFSPFLGAGAVAPPPSPSRAGPPPPLLVGRAPLSPAPAHAPPPPTDGLPSSSSATGNSPGSASAGGSAAGAAGGTLCFNGRAADGLGREVDARLLRSAARLQLVPIDHGLCLPSVAHLDDFDFCWVGWRQSKAPLSAASLAHIAALDGRHDALLLWSALGDHLRPSSLLTLRLTTALLQAGAAAGLNLNEIARMMSREGGLGRVEGRGAGRETAGRAEGGVGGGGGGEGAAAAASGGGGGGGGAPGASVTDSPRPFSSAAAKRAEQAERKRKKRALQKLRRGRERQRIEALGGEGDGGVGHPTGSVEGGGEGAASDAPPPPPSALEQCVTKARNMVSKSKGGKRWAAAAAVVVAPPPTPVRGAAAPSAAAPAAVPPDAPPAGGRPKGSGGGGDEKKSWNMPSKSGRKGRRRDGAAGARGSFASTGSGGSGVGGSAPVSASASPVLSAMSSSVPSPLPPNEASPPLLYAAVPPRERWPAEHAQGAAVAELPPFFNYHDRMVAAFLEVIKPHIAAVIRKRASK